MNTMPGHLYWKRRKFSIELFFPKMTKVYVS